MPPAKSTATKKAAAKTATPPDRTTTSDAIWAVVGSDEAEVKRLALQRAGELTPADAGEMGKEIIDGVAESADQAATRIHQTVEALETLPFFGGSKLVWLKNANFLADTVLGRSAAVQGALEKLVETLQKGLPNGVRFLLSAPEIDKRRSFYKTLGKVGEVEVREKIDTSRAGWEDEAAANAAQRARALGLQLRGEALELFTLQTGGDSRQIDNELQKLDLYLQPLGSQPLQASAAPVSVASADHPTLGVSPANALREVTLDAVRKIVPASRASVIFDLGNAISARNLPAALELVEQLLYQGESAIGILLVAIIPSVRNLLLAKDLMQRHRLPRPGAPFQFTGTLNRLPTDATAHLPRKKDGGLNTYALGLAAMHTQRYSLDELREALRACLDANVALVTSGLEPRMVLTQLVVKIAAV